MGGSGSGKVEKAIGSLRLPASAHFGGQAPDPTAGARRDPPPKGAQAGALGYIPGMHRWAAVAALLASGCGSGDGPNSSTGTPDGGDPCSFSCLDGSTAGRPLALQVKGILDTCAGADCHDIGAGSMRVAPGSEFDTMIGVRASERPDLFRVKPGDPLQSYVYLKVLCDAGGITGSCMPPGGAAAGIARTFHDWMEAGAPTM